MSIIDNFVDNGTDEMIVKSLTDEDLTDDLEKARHYYDKDYLVQKPTKYVTRSGKIGIRMQWKEPDRNEDSGSDAEPDKAAKFDNPDDIGAKKKHMSGDPSGKSGKSDKNDKKLDVDRYLEGKYSKISAKAGLAKILEQGTDKKTVMNKAKNHEINWENSDEEDINWTRASVAIVKHVNSIIQSNKGNDNNE